MLGFDIINYTIAGLRKYDRNFISCLSKLQPSSYMGPYLFKKVSNDGGWENQREILVKYTKNYEVLTEAQPELK